MKKTTVRFATVGTVLLLSALAVALAQHDARQRTKDEALASKPLPESPRPILVEDMEPNWTAAKPSQTLVRANDDQPLGAPPSLSASNHDEDDNPLRPQRLSASLASSLKEIESNSADTSHVELASGQLPVGSLPSTSAPAGGLPPQQSTLPQAPLPQPTLPPQGLGQPVVTQPGMSSAATAQPALAVPAGKTTPGSNLSNSGAMPATNLLGAPSIPSSASTPTAPGLAAPGLAAPGVLGGPSASSVPSGLATNGNSQAASGGARNTNLPPGWVNQSSLPASQSLSDTQRPAMPRTDLTQSSNASTSNASPSNASPSNASPSNASGQSWLQAPASGQNLAPPSVDGLPQVAGNGATAQLSDRRAPNDALPSSSAFSQNSLPPNTLSQGSNVNLNAPPANATLSAPQPSSNARTSSSMVQQPGLGSSSISSPATSRSSGALASYASPSSSQLASLASNVPGNHQLDGSQNPMMVLQKRMAGECQVGKRTTIVITVRNTGNTVAQGVEVIDQVPNGTSFAEASPAVTPSPEGVLVWSLGEMPPGDERTIQLQIIPERQGEIGSIAALRMVAQSSVRSVATLPKVELTINAAPEVLIGSGHSIDIVLKNTGTGVAKAVLLEADLPDNLQHESGRPRLEKIIGDLAPNETRQIRLESIAIAAGAAACKIRAICEDEPHAEKDVPLKVQAPALKGTITGPSRRFLDRPATFLISLQNTGTATATNCDFVLRLPAGLNFNSANNLGTYDPSQHAVFWSLPELPAGQPAQLEVTVLPVDIGAQELYFQGSADLQVKMEARGSMLVEEQAELEFTIDEDADPIELSSSTTYVVTAKNIGKTDRNIELVVQLPPGSKVLKVADAPVKYRIQGDQLVFEPIPQMDNGAIQRFRFEVQHAQVGTQIVRAQLKSQNRPAPVSKDEGTEVYNDQN